MSRQVDGREARSAVYAYTLLGGVCRYHEEMWVQTLQLSDLIAKHSVSPLEWMLLAPRSVAKRWHVSTQSVYQAAKRGDLDLVVVTDHEGEKLFSGFKWSSVRAYEEAAKRSAYAKIKLPVDRGKRPR